MRVRDSDGEVLARFTYRDALVSLLQDRLTN
jgi:hypothetical protein